MFRFKQFQALHKKKKKRKRETLFTTACALLSTFAAGRARHVGSGQGPRVPLQDGTTGLTVHHEVGWCRILFLMTDFLWITFFPSKAHLGSHPRQKKKANYQ